MKFKFEKSFGPKKMLAVQYPYDTKFSGSESLKKFQLVSGQINISLSKIRKKKCQAPLKKFSPRSLIGHFLRLWETVHTGKQAWHQEQHDATSTPPERHAQSSQCRYSGAHTGRVHGLIVQHWCQVAAIILALLAYNLDGDVALIYCWFITGENYTKTKK